MEARSSVCVVKRRIFVKTLRPLGPSSRLIKSIATPKFLDDENSLALENSRLGETPYFFVTMVFGLPGERDLQRFCKQKNRGQKFEGRPSKNASLQKVSAKGVGKKDEV